MIVTTAQLFKIAYGKYAIGAYNINNAEQTMGPFKGKQSLHFDVLEKIKSRPWQDHCRTTTTKNTCQNTNTQTI